MNRLIGSVRSNPYGLVMIVMAALAMVATLPGRTHGLGMITERLLADPVLRLDRITYANMNLWATLLGGLYCLPCGYLIDRFGLRVTLSVTAASLGLAVLGMTWTTNSWTFFVCLMQTRGFGQSALSVISIAMVGKWYGGKLTFPMAVYTLLLGLGFALAPQLAKEYATADWRITWGGMGWILLVGMTPLALALTRDPKPIADSAGESKSRFEGGVNRFSPKGTPPSTEPGFTVLQAMQTQAFWLFGLAISVIALVGSGQSLFNESILKQQGFPAETFYNLITLSGMVGLVVKLPIGWLGQHCALNRLHAAGLFLLTGCLIYLPFVRPEWSSTIQYGGKDVVISWGITLYGLGMGVSGTITTVLFFSVWGQTFGRPHLGQIQSIAQMMTVLASAAGPLVFAECFERYESYAPAFRVLAGIVAVLAVWSLVIRMPTPADAPQSDPAPLPLPSLQESPA